MRIWKYLAVVVVFFALLAASSVFPNIGLYYISTTDPTTGAGVSAPNYQLLWRTDDPSIYFKSGPSNTAWTKAGVGAVSPTAAGADWLFGTGIDGDINFDGVTAVKGVVPAANVYNFSGLNVDIYARNMNVAAGVTVIPASSAFYVQGTLTGTGTIANDGATGGVAVPTGGVQLVPGALAAPVWNGVTCTPGRTNSASSYYWCVDGFGAGGGTSNVALNPGANGASCQGGGGGGSSGGGAPINSSQVTRYAGWPYTFAGPLNYALMGRDWSSPGTLMSGAAHGGCGFGGSAGRGGGWVHLMVRNCGTGSVSVSARGGDGAAPASNCYTLGSCACGGGGGGPGGTIVVYCGAGTLPATNNTPGSGGLPATNACVNAAGNPCSGAGCCCAGKGGCGGTGMKFLFSPSTGWTTTPDPIPNGC